MSSLIQDLRHAFRIARRQPGFALTAILTLALAIGANTAIFSLVQAALLRPLPFDDPDRLTLVWETHLGRGRVRNVANPGNFVAWKERNHVFEDMAAFAAWKANLAGVGGAERVPSGEVTVNFFSVMGVRPQLGRAFVPADGAPKAPDVVILSAGLWRQRYGADPGVLGRSLVVNGAPATVVGVMPDGFDIPLASKVWLPMAISEEWRTSQGRWMTTVARLKLGVTAAQARADVERIAALTRQERPDFNAGWSATVVPLKADLVRDVKPALLVLLTAVGLVLLVACANVANLLLASAVRRERELAIRAALGAGLGRLARQMLVESLALALAGGAGGLLLANWCLDGLVALLPAEIPAFMAVRLDFGVFAFALVASTLAALLSGLLPILRLRRPAAAEGLRAGTASSARPERRRIARVLVVAEMTVAAVLLVGAGLLVRSFDRLLGTNPGFEARDVLTFQVSLDEGRYPEPSAQARFHGTAAERLAGLPGVESAAAMSWQLLGMGSATSYVVLDRPAPPPEDEPTAEVRVVTPRLFETLGIPILEGRDFGARDGETAPRAVIVNSALAREHWPGQSALGKRIRMSWGEDLEAEVVGVVGDVRFRSLGETPPATLYWAAPQLPYSFMTYFVRSRVDRGALVPAVRSTMATPDDSVPLAELGPLDGVVWASVGRPYFVFVLATAFATLAALLSGVGLFGVIAESVSLRRRELAVRLALGASRRDIVGVVLSEAGTLVVLGGVLGLVLARGAATLLRSQLYGTSPGSPDVYAAAAAFTGLVALAALLVPARRALAADPVRDLRAE